MRALLVPIKAFGAAKLRLAPVLDRAARAELARQLAAGVLQAGGALQCFVVCDDTEVADFSRSYGAEVLWTPGLGLSGAVQSGVAMLAGRGIDLVVVSHADLPYVAGLDVIGDEGEVTLVPDRHGDGTNVAVVPAQAGFCFSYGPGSFGRHQLEAARLSLTCRVVHDAGLAVDVDVPEDLLLLGAHPGGGRPGLPGLSAD